MKEAIKLKSGFEKSIFNFSSLVLYAEIAINLNTVSHEKTQFIMRFNIL